MQKNLNWTTIKELHSLGFNDNEIARKIGASVNGVRYVRKDKLNLPHNIHTYIINDEMQSIIIGTLLGDAWVGYVHKQCKYPKYQTSHSVSQYQYLMHIYNKLKSIMTPSIIKHIGGTAVIKGRQCIKKDHYTICSRNIENLIIYREAFYPKDYKVIPINFIRDIFTDVSLAHWFMDDGSVDRHSHSYIINTQCFSRENLKDFVKFLYDKFELQFSIKQDNTLYLRHCSNYIFENLVSPHLTKDMRYKIVSS